MKSSLFTFFSSAAFATTVFAQSTLGDPVPLLGNQAQSIAANAALGAHSFPNSKTPEQRAALQAQQAKRSACRKEALNAPAGAQRARIRERCKTLYGNDTVAKQVK
jgi:hypothetical protein